MKILSYTIGSVNDIDLLPLLERVQFTLNGKARPSRRNITKALDRLQNKNVDIYIHEDFVRTAPRYGFLTDEYREEMAIELADILSYSLTHPNIKGVVIHTDNPISQDMIKFLSKSDEFNHEVIRTACLKYIGSRIFRPTSEIANMMIGVYDKFKSQPGSDCVQDLISSWNRYSISLLSYDVTNILTKRGLDITKCCKIYLENTSHVYYTGKEAKTTVIEGTVMANAMHSLINPILGYCWDTEHAFAAGDFIFESDLEQFKKIYSLNKKLLVHLNTIEKGVSRGSKKDRHSMTAINECSVYPQNYYFELVDLFNKLGIPYIREVKSETMNRELNYQRSLDE